MLFKKSRSRAKLSKVEDEIVIDAVVPKRVKGVLCKQVSFWRGNVRYSTLVSHDVNIQVGTHMLYSQLPESLVPVLSCTEADIEGMLRAKALSIGMSSDKEIAQWIDTQASVYDTLYPDNSLDETYKAYFMVFDSKQR